MKSQFASLETLLSELSARLDQVERHTDRMELILTVREPGSSAAADAYDGLRKQIVAAVTDRLAHLTQLVQFDAALRNGATPEILASMVKSWMEASALAAIVDGSHDQSDLLFDVVEDLGGAFEVLEPAYVDSQSNRVIRRGRVRRRAPIEAPQTREDVVIEPTDFAAESIEGVQSELADGPLRSDG